MQPTRWTFAGFDIDLTASILRKNGEPVRIGRQAFRALALLVAKGGQVVTREELQKEIWGDRVHVDFEQGLNVCIRQVRTALVDNDENHQIIVTCPREGYRLGVTAKRVRQVHWPSFELGWPSFRVPSLRQLGATTGVAALLAAGYLLLPPAGRGDAVASSEVAPVVRPTRSFEAAGWYWRGRAYYDRATGRKPFAALPYFEQATVLDPGFALAHAGLAVSYLDQAEAAIAPAESAIKARQAAQRALTLDPQSAEAHVALGELSYRLDEDDAGALREFMQAVELDGRNAYVRQRYAVFLKEQRRFEEALEQLRVAQTLDPVSVLSSWQQADTLFLAHRYEESLAQAYHTLELDPTHSWSLRTVGQSLDALGRPEEAIDAYLQAGQVAFGHLGRLYALLGRQSAAREILATLTQRPVEKVGHSGVAIAYIYTGLGETDKAIEWLEKAHRDGVRLPFSLRVAPQWAPLRTNREFDEFLKRSRVAGI